MNRRLRWKIAVVLAVIAGSSMCLFKKGLTLGLDLKGGVQFTLRVNVEEGLRAETQATRDEIVAQAKYAVDRRINELGVVEPMIAVQGANRDQILVQLPGFTDVARARKVLGTTARLEWKLLEAGPDTPAEVTGSDIKHARSTFDENGQPMVAFSLTPDGGRRFAALTAAHIGQRLAIVLDGQVQSAPVIEDAIPGGEGIIRGGFTVQEATDLALVLRAGALPVSLTFLGGQYVGPTLGAQSIAAGVTASLAGLAIVGAFMLVYYNRAGINAIISVAVNLLVLLAAMAAMGSSMTLPGIAGLILTIGMGVDSSVLIFERIKEELRTGRSARAAVADGFNRVFLTILDTHVASLVAAAFLFQFGTGPIRGFATTLSIGLLANVFTAVTVSRTLFEIALLRRSATLKLSTFVLPVRRAFDFMSWSRYAVLASTLIVASACALLLSRGLPLGLDFTGGTSVVTTFSSPVSEEDARRAIPGDVTIQRYGTTPDRSLLIRLAQSPTAVEDTDVETGVNTIAAALAAAPLPPFEIGGSEMVGPAIGADLQRKGMYAAFASLTGIAGYIALRFRPSFAIGAIAATTHDIVVTVSMLSLAGYDLTLNVVAAVLTIAGYSVNDTIVVFDRVRENVRGAGRLPIASAVNVAVNQTLGRTVITAGTTFLSVLALYFLGGDVLEGFAFAMLVGIVTGTYSTVFIAAPLAAWLSQRRVHKFVGHEN